jgi:hypothetical protein
LGVCISCFKIDGAQRAKWTFLNVQKNVQKRGVKFLRSFLPSAVLNEIFLTEMSLKYDLAIAQNPNFINYSFLNGIFLAEKEEFQKNPVL